MGARTDMDDNCYNLSRNDFERSSSHAFKLLKLDTDFLDVTLACEDGKQLKAHKVVLSSFSSVFQSILKQNSHKNPLLYLTEISYLFLQKILDFIYLGQTVVNKHEFEEFMKMAEKFKIDGLVRKDQRPPETKKLHERETATANVLERADSDIFDNHEQLIDPKQELYQNDFVSYEKTSNQTLTDMNDIEVQNELPEKLNFLNRSRSKFPCDECQYSATTKSNLKTHVLAKHLGVKFPCNYCDFQGSTKGNTHYHMKNMHSAMN